MLGRALQFGNKLEPSLKKDDLGYYTGYKINLCFWHLLWPIGRPRVWSRRAGVAAVWWHPWSTWRFFLSTTPRRLRWIQSTPRLLSLVHLDLQVAHQSRSVSLFRSTCGCMSATRTLHQTCLLKDQETTIWSMDSRFLIIEKVRLVGV